LEAAWKQHCNYSPFVVGNSLFMWLVSSFAILQADKLLSLAA
jgi:hypothetical protein